MMTLYNGPGRGRFVNSALTMIEDAVYVGLGIILAVTAIYLLVSSVFSLATAIGKGALAGEVIGLLDQVLLILLVVELLYTVQVSLREHSLLAQPFLVVALIAIVRKVLVLTAQISSPDSPEVVFRHSMEELALLSVMMLVLVGSLILLHRHGSSDHQMDNDSDHLNVVRG